MQWAADVLATLCLSLDMSDNLGAATDAQRAFAVFCSLTSAHICIPNIQASKPATDSLCACSAGCNAVMRARTLRRCITAAPRSSDCKAWRLAAATTSECRLQTQSAEGSGALKPASQPLACRHSRLASWNAVWMLTPCKRGSPCLTMLLC